MGFPEQKRNAKFAELCNLYGEKEINPYWRDVVMVEPTSFIEHCQASAAGSQQ